MSDLNLQPVRFSTPVERLRDDFVKISCVQNPSGLWHFGIGLPKTSRAAKPSGEVPVAGGPMVSLALFNRPEPLCDIEVYGQQLSWEIDPADYLDLWVEQQKLEVLSRMRVEMIGGAVGDLVVKWELEGKQYMGRLFATKAGSRFLMIWFRCGAGDYAGLAESMFLTLTTFRMVDESPGVLAEKIRWAGSALPVEWRTAVPDPWKITQEPASEAVASFQATLMEEGKSGESVLGKLSFMVLAGDKAGHVSQVFDHLFLVIRQAGGAFEMGTPVAERVSGPYLLRSYCRVVGKFGGVDAELHCRVMRHEKVWVAGMVLTQPRGSAPALWMRNKRVLDIVMGTLEVK